MFHLLLAPARAFHPTRMSFVSIWVHVVWATKRRQSVLKKPVRYTIFNHIRENALNKGIHLDHINGYDDHVHCLISMNPDQNIAAIVQALKGESAYWVNHKTDLLEQPLKWCEDYYAASVSTSGLDAVRNYIRNQEIHHSRKSFKRECREFIQIYGFDRVLGGG
jgi:putative transposase